MEMGIGLFQFVSEVMNNIEAENMLSPKEALEFKRCWIDKIIELQAKNNQSSDSRPEKRAKISRDEGEEDEANDADIDVDDCIDQSNPCPNELCCECKVLFLSLKFH